MAEYIFEGEIELTGDVTLYGFSASPQSGDSLERLWRIWSIWSIWRESTPSIPALSTASEAARSPPEAALTLFGCDVRGVAGESRRRAILG